MSKQKKKKNETRTPQIKHGFSLFNYNEMKILVHQLKIAFWDFVNCKFEIKLLNFFFIIYNASMNFNIEEFMMLSFQENYF